MGLALVGAVLTVPRPMGPHARTVTLSRCPPGRGFAVLSPSSVGPVGRASKPDAVPSPTDASSKTDAVPSPTGRASKPDT